jgi:hypothetical protein
MGAEGDTIKEVQQWKQTIAKTCEEQKESRA